MSRDKPIDQNRKPRRIIQAIGTYAARLGERLQADDKQAVVVADPKKKAARQPARGNSPPLKPLAEERPTAETIIAVVLGLEEDNLIRVLDLLKRGGAGLDVVPVVLTDSTDFRLFRERRIVFEYFPPREHQERFAPGLNWSLYRLRRLALLRRKWQPLRIIAFGTNAGDVLNDWRHSPFEDAAIVDVISGVPGLDSKRTAT